MRREFHLKAAGADKMFVLHVDKNKATVRDSNEIITSGSVNVYTVQFQFSTEWVDLTRVAVFKAGADAKSVLLDDTNQCTIPWEVTIKSRKILYVGVMGTKDGKIVLPTVWEPIGEIKDGTSSAEAAGPPTPSLWEQELARKGDALGITEDGQLGLYAGETLLSHVPMVSGPPGEKGDNGDTPYIGENGNWWIWETDTGVPAAGSGESGTTDHRALTHREDEDAHPIGAITHLERELAKRVTADDALSVVDIIKIMEG